MGNFHNFPSTMFTFSCAIWWFAWTNCTRVHPFRGEVVDPSQQTQNICMAFVECWTNVEDVGPTLYKCYTNVLCLLRLLWLIEWGVMIPCRFNMGWLKQWNNNRETSAAQQSQDYQSILKATDIHIRLVIDRDGGIDQSHALDQPPHRPCPNSTHMQTIYT